MDVRWSQNNLCAGLWRRSIWVSGLSYSVHTPPLCCKHLINTPLAPRYSKTKKAKAKAKWNQKAMQVTCPRPCRPTLIFSPPSTARGTLGAVRHGYLTLDVRRGTYLQECSHRFICTANLQLEEVRTFPIAAFGGALSCKGKKKRVRQSCKSWRKCHS